MPNQSPQKCDASVIQQVLIKALSLRLTNDSSGIVYR